MTVRNLVQRVIPVLAVAAVLAVSFVVSPGRIQNAAAACSYGYLGTGPTVTGVFWAAGPTIGGTGITISGCGFTGATSVKFGTSSAAFTVVSDSTIKATSPAHAAGVVDITVATAVPFSTSATNPSDLYRYTSAGWCAQFNMSRVPTHWVKGQTQKFYVYVLNCGLNTWPALPYYRVDINVHFTTKRGSGFNTQSSWLNQTYHNLSKNQGPNSVVAIAITLKPTFRGTVFLEAEMIKLHQFWFGRYLYRPPQFAAVVVSVT